MTQLRISEVALSIVEQADYYAQAEGTNLSIKWEEAVDDVVRSLLIYPKRGAICRFRNPALADIRWVPVPGFPSHMIFYRYSSAEPTIFIVQVLHGARNLEAILNEEA